MHSPVAPEHKVMWQLSPFRMGKRYQIVTENTKPSQRSPKCFCNLGVKCCLISTCASVADRSERRMCSQVWKGMALLIRGELPRVFCEGHLVLTLQIGMRARGRWGLFSHVQSPKPYPVLLLQFFCSVSNTPFKVMGLVLAFTRGTS